MFSLMSILSPFWTRSGSPREPRWVIRRSSRVAASQWHNAGSHTRHTPLISVTMDAHNTLMYSRHWARCTDDPRWLSPWIWIDGETRSLAYCLRFPYALQNSKETALFISYLVNKVTGFIFIPILVKDVTFNDNCYTAGIHTLDVFKYVTPTYWRRRVTSEVLV